MMQLVLVAGVFALAAPQQQVDTTMAVRPGGTLYIEAQRGSAVVRTWDRDAVRITGPTGVTGAAGRRDATIRTQGGNVVIEVHGMAQARYEVTVPRSFHVRVDGMNIGVTVEGLQGDVRIDNVEGAITVRDVTGTIEVESVSGVVTIENTRGRISAVTVNQGIRINGARGDIAAETVNGSVVIRRAQSSNVRANTVNGLVDYDGTIADGGRYYLGTHNGRITMSIAEQTNAAVTASTTTGKVESAFAVPVSALRGGTASFRLGTGSARVELETFNGTIYLVRPGGR
jgi:DUF4097 and DUF4098 domain-containing protein YvlB